MGDFVQIFVESGQVNNVDACDEKYGLTPLMLASVEGHLDIVKYLVEKGANVDAFDDKNYTAMMHANANNRLEILKYLMEIRGGVDNQQLLLNACKKGHLAVVKYLLEKGANVDAHNIEESTSSLILACNGGHLEVVKYLVEEGADVHARDSLHDSTLMVACKVGHLELTKYLVEKGVDIHARNIRNMTAFDFASMYGHADISTYLRSQTKKRKRDDVGVDERETSRPRYTGRKESQHFTNSSSSTNGGKEFDIEAIYKTNLFPQEVPKPQLTTTYKERPITVELTMSHENKGVGWYQEDSEMDYQLTVNFKIKENKLDAELDIKESEKEIVEEPFTPPKYEKPKRHCPICQKAIRYKNKMAIKKPRKFKAGEIECYPFFKAWYNDLPSWEKDGKKKHPISDNELNRTRFNNNCVGQIEKRKKAEEEKARRQAEEEEERN